MNIIVCDNYQELSVMAGDIMAAVVKENENCVLGLATGSTPVGAYQELIKKHQAGELDFAHVTTFNLDEYYPMAVDNAQSYHVFMQENLFKSINVPADKIHVPDGSVEDAQAQCEWYDEQIEKAGGIDLMLLGIGENGHIGFNEPGDSLECGTHIHKLTESTLQANARFFGEGEQMPTHAITMGVASIIRNSRKILMLVNGVKKYPILKALQEDVVTTQIPASLLRLHPDVTVICDKAAFYGEA